MATDGRPASHARERLGHVLFRCHGCAIRFPDDPGGPGCCPRCGAIGGHERLGRPDDVR